MSNSIPEIRDLDFMFIIGSNTTEAHPIIAMEMKVARQRGARMVVADPRKIWLTEYCDMHLQLKPGTDVWLVNAMAQVIVDKGLVDKDFIAKHTEGWPELKANLAKFKLAEAERVTGVPAALIKAAAIEYATTRKAAIYYTLGITEHAHGTDNIFSLANLVMMTGHLGVPFGGLNSLRGQNNVQGATDAGATPLYYTGFQPAGDPAIRAKFEAAWQTELTAGVGKNLNEIMKGVEDGSVKALYVMGEDILISEPNTNHLEHGVKKLEFLIHQDIFMNETTKYAHVVFPGANFAEKDGVFTNTDRRVQRVRKAVNPPGNARPDWEILCDFARAAGYAMPHYSDPGEVYAEIASLAPRYAGISHERLDATPMGIQWPCPSPDHPGTVYMHKDGPVKGKGTFIITNFRPPVELPDEEYPYNLATGRVLYHYNAGTQTRRDSGTMAKVGECQIEVHAEDAARLGVKDGDKVKVVSRRGGVYAKVWISGRVQKGNVWMPLHFTEAAINKLTIDVGDPLAGTAEYKVCAVNLLPVKPGNGDTPEHESDPALVSLHKGNGQH
ncbi:MAG: molybdopterin-dependent oxidoreductase [Planctomycetes bacterium]|nr:molybdopterin-dependent oxidoreductase [Planctomycetota bacterium]MCW8134324.1 molybdopterin-dependent oxidoreductase [Planctomycetota bacterium]